MEILHFRRQKNNIEKVCVVNDLKKPPINGCFLIELIDRGMDGWMDGWIDGWMDGWMGIHMGGWICGRINVHI